jgi:hypothetical protein
MPGHVTRIGVTGHRQIPEAALPAVRSGIRAELQGRPATTRLLKCCGERVELTRERTHEEAYYAAGRYIVDHADRLIAVWDGDPPRGLGGTADVVDYARLIGVPVTVLWSPGVRRA